MIPKGAGRQQAAQTFKNRTNQHNSFISRTTPCRPRAKARGLHSCPYRGLLLPALSPALHLRYLRPRVSSTESQDLDRTDATWHIGNHMVTNSSEHLDRTFSALADPTRRAILEHLSQGRASVGELADPFRMSRPAISKHLRVLERAGLVQRRQDGRMSRCALDATPMKNAADWVDRYRRYWEQQLDALARYFETEEETRGNADDD